MIQTHHKFGMHSNAFENDDWDACECVCGRIFAHVSEIYKRVQVGSSVDAFVVLSMTLFYRNASERWHLQQKRIYAHLNCVSCLHGSSLILFVQKHPTTWMWTSNSSRYPWLIARCGLKIAHFLIRWKIQGTDTHEYNVRKFTAEYGNGEVFVFDVSDGTNEISVASFNLQSQDFQSRIQLAQVHVPPIRVSLEKWSEGSWIDLILEKVCDLTVDHAEDCWEVPTISIEFRHLSWSLA